MPFKKNAPLKGKDAAIVRQLTGFGKNGIMAEVANYTQHISNVLIVGDIVNDIDIAVQKNKETRLL